MQQNTMANFGNFELSESTTQTHSLRGGRAGTFSRWVNDRVKRLLILIIFGVSSPTLFADVGTIPEISLIAKEITAIIAAKQHPLLLPGNFTNRAEDLDALYKLANYQLLWIGKNASSASNIAAALELLDSAPANGLQKNQYDVESLQKKLPAILQADPVSYTELASFDTALSLSLLRFLHDLHYGRVSPQIINFNLRLREKKVLDLSTVILNSINQQSIGQLPGKVEPQIKQYQLLKASLVNYRELARQAKPFQWIFTKSIRPGENFSELNALRDFLVTIGDLPKDQQEAVNPKASRYSGDIVTAMKKFQRRHGLASDGVIGKTTAIELTTDLQKRVVQIELAMERLRWLPELSAGPSVIVNIPAFQLWALDDINDLNSSVTQMRVVVGKAMKNQTPVLMASMSFIDFAPYWNVPYNIVKDEIIPKLGGGPGYLAKENMELISKSGVVGFSGSTVAQLKQGNLRIRQKPGKKNALGRVKFLFPNKDDVYLHDTPSGSLFSRSRRDFSHGCVRVNDPAALAEFALRNQKGWDKAKIKQAMASPKLQRVILNKPIPVLFFYTTAFFDQNNELVFYADIYDHDTVLQEALKAPGELSDQMLFVQASQPTKEKIDGEATTTSAAGTIKTVEIVK